MIEEYKRDKLQLLRDKKFEVYGARMRQAVKEKYKNKTRILMDLIISEEKLDEFDQIFAEIVMDATLFNQYGKLYDTFGRVTSR